jgi:hypothetical protein
MIALTMYPSGECDGFSNMGCAKFSASMCSVHSDLHKKYRPPLMRWAICWLGFVCLLHRQATPAGPTTAARFGLIIIIIADEVNAFHSGGIIAHVVWTQDIFCAKA